MFFAVFQEDEIAIFAAQILRSPHEENVTTTGSHPFQFPLLSHFADMAKERMDWMRTRKG